MIGKSALLVILGFISAFTVYQLKLVQTAVNATDNFNREYLNTLVHESALSAMNIGITEVWEKQVNDSSFSFVINNCSTDVVISPVGIDTVKLKVKAWRYAFNEEIFRKTQKKDKIRDSVVAYFVYNTPASRFFWFTNEEGFIYWITGDSVWGPVHTNSVLRTSGAPVFYGKVTAKLGISPLPDFWWNQAKFYGGWEIGVENQIPTDLSPLYNAALAGNNGAPANTKSIYNSVTSFEFLSDGNVIRTVSNNPPDTVSLSEIAPTGVIYSTDDIHVKGHLNGVITLCTEQDIWIDDDIVYSTSNGSDEDEDEDHHEDDDDDSPEDNAHPDDDEHHDEDEHQDDDEHQDEDEHHEDDEEDSGSNSSSILGLVAKNNVIVTDNAANNDNVEIHAAIMAINGSFYAEHYNTRPVAGELKVVGSMVQNIRGPIGTFSWWNNQILSGFSKNYRFDTRFSAISPPKYPYVRQLRLDAWWE